MLCVTPFQVQPITEIAGASIRDCNPEKGFGLYFLMMGCQGGYLGLIYRIEVIIPRVFCTTTKYKKEFIL